MKSSACRHGECALCHPTGIILLQHGKVIGCECECHPPKTRGAKPSKKEETED